MPRMVRLGLGMLLPESEMWAAAFVAVALSASAENRCWPWVQVEGQDPLRASIERELNLRGIEIVALDGCDGFHADVEQQGPSLSVRIVDPYGRTALRTVSRAETAASLIESWVRADVPLRVDHAPLRPPERQHRLPIQSHPVEAAQEAEVALEPDSRLTTKMSLAMAVEGAMDNEGQLWVGGSASAWFRAGSLYVGPGARILAISRKDDDAALDPIGIMAELLASAELRLLVGPLILRPGAGLGAAYVRMSWEPLEGLATDLEARSRKSTITPRAHLHLRASSPLSDHVALELGLEADFAPSAAAPRSINGIELPAEPFMLAGLSLGISWEGP